ncbi:predicted protein [Phaeodactylum tricornutum CCAP 1055/1]|jgi:hypothetical protein|uniref:Uncharacterized protein n=1 Tax=Phaeodactylum tricornutum (strain CCAP 1055/1) TaxID=556484 RepID=B5Y495_PHATC|nr:predicted protein [Phaeodactylum tricornutum CCAP 1055/1]ACI65439.1 predicted protein [Phaeodactylum tricornutum CCAP 1055/1]|eukprot:XP_002185969.1 predicted protein [Phaeodactylum tricornutum CCAP 1055/1]
MYVEGTVVADGNHAVPKGVAVEELNSGKKGLQEKCPPDLKELLEKKGLIAVYDDLVKSVVDASRTRNVFGRWRDQEFVSIIDQFRDLFASKGVKVALCKRESGSGVRRWLEFIDVDIAGMYVPQYDVANLSGQVIKTMYATLKFPNGVGVEELRQMGGRKRLKEKIPVQVEEIIARKGLMDAYDALILAIVNEGAGKHTKMWNIEKLKEIVHSHQPNFAVKGVEVFVSHKQEYVSHGQYGGHHEYFRWVEFVDRELQPNYHPQRDADSKSEKCVIS